ncbi:sigma-54 specific flagellar transcriptional regulator A [Simiduia aestuariiviva]|uniref:Sigma-54 specific flagellar transcriptional regulator A n=1 Tax=Simiduia aestuariiviva TaxID=1510459 RepID=A0A839UPH9_9GAMM|nr:sigma-54 dependent transcriptional regulator [Simiduia aestuariiviva]MBB3168430.1 sigma-54 specific flagellar transcriptional regulator A [Simiduia aestuariiviva]
MLLEPIKILVVDDNASRRHDLKVILDFMGESALTVDTSHWEEEADLADAAHRYSAVLLGENKDNPSLLSRLQRVHDWDQGLPVVLVGQEAELPEDCNPYLKHKIIGLVPENPTYNQLLDLLHRAQRFRATLSRNAKVGLKGTPHLFRSLVGSTVAMDKMREMMARVADKDVTVLITGESGTGKEVVARNLHNHSDRRDRPFVPVNCGAIPAELLESELFGHEKGAFTGAIGSRAGRFEMAEGGTLFLDEIGDMPLNMQVKILRVLQERCFERVGSNRSQPTDVRIIAATHRNLESMITEGEFREDLFYRLNVFPIEVPALRERAADIPMLITELVSRMEAEKRGTVRFNSNAILSLTRHEWAGNVRELANLVERMAILHPNSVVGSQDLPAKYQHVEAEELAAFEELVEQGTQPVIKVGESPLLPAHGIDLKEYLTNLECSLIQQALDDTGGVVARAADRLAIRRTTLVEKMRKYGLSR